MKLSTILYIWAVADLCLALFLEINTTFFLGSLSRYAPALLAATGYYFSVKEKTANFSFSLDEGESLIWSHISMGLAFGLTEETLLFSYASESYIEDTRKYSGKNINFPEAVDTKINRTDIESVGVEKSKLREVISIKLQDGNKINLPLMGKKKDELLGLLQQ
jgi:hypothetical protein